jgi:flagellar hook-associated protein 2
MANPITASSAIDVQSLVSTLMRAERKPLAQVQEEASRIGTKISEFGKLQSEIARFRDGAAELARAPTWRAVTASSTNATAVEVTARTGAAAAQHTVEVTQLAQAQTVTSAAMAGTDTVIGGGTLRIQLGTQPSGPTSFSADLARPEVSIAIAANATLADVRDAINAQDAGVRASIVRDGDQFRLFVTGTTSGGNQAFRMQVDDDDGGSTDATGLSAIAFDPTAPAGAGRNLSLVRPATDASYSIDGVALTARGNRIENALDGVDLVLRQVTSAPVELDVKQDTGAMKAAMEKFVAAYNGLNTLLQAQTRYDAGSRTAGPLQGDRSAVGILERVRGALRETVAGSSLGSLAGAGVTLQRDGSLQLDASRFESAAGDPKQLEQLFSAIGTDDTDRGLMLRLRELGDSLNGADGAVKTATAAWEARRTENQRRQDALELRLSDVEKRLLRQFTSLDAQLAAAQQSGAALASALAGLPGTGR